LVMTGPLVALAGLAILGGALNLPGLPALASWLGRTLGEAEAAAFNPLVALVSILLALVAIAAAWLLYGRRPLAEGEADPLRRLLGPVFVGIQNKWWIDEFYDWLVVRRYVRLAAFLAEVIDGRFWHDWFHDTLMARSFRMGTRWLAEAFDLRVIDGAANGLADLIKAAAGRLHRLQTGFVRNYALALFLGAVGLLAYFLLQR